MGSELPGWEHRFVERLKRERALRDWTQADVARKMNERGVNAYATTVAKIESFGPNHRAVRLEEAAVIADIFDVSLDDMVGTGATDIASMLSAFRQFLASALTDITDISDATNDIRGRWRMSADDISRRVGSSPDDEMTADLARAVLAFDESRNLTGDLQLAKQRVHQAIQKATLPDEDLAVRVGGDVNDPVAIRRFLENFVPGHRDSAIEVHQRGVS